MKNAKYVRSAMIELWFDGFRSGLQSGHLAEHMKRRTSIIENKMRAIAPRLKNDKSKRKAARR